MLKHFEKPDFEGGCGMMALIGIVFVLALIMLIYQITWE